MEPHLYTGQGDSYLDIKAIAVKWRNIPANENPKMTTFDDSQL